MFRSFISWRYLTSRRTNLIGVAGVWVALCALIVIISIMTGFLETSRQHVRGSLSDILVKPNFTFGIDEAPPGPVLDIVRAHPEVVSATPQIQWAGILVGRDDKYEQVMSNSYYAGLLFVQLVGVEVRSAERLAQPALRALMASFGGHWAPYSLADEFDTTELGADLRAARRGGGPRPDGEERLDIRSPFPFAPPETYRPISRPARGVLIGWRLAQSLSILPGDELRIATVVNDPNAQSTEQNWVINNREFVVAGIFRTQDNETDRTRIYFERDELADFLGQTREYTHILTRLEDFEENGEDVRDDLRVDLAAAGLIDGPTSEEVVTWEDFRGNLLGAIENERVLMGIMLSLVLLVSGFTVFAILSMMVTEKRRDIGILRALGATPTGVRQLFLLIAFWDALVGAILGTTTGVILARNIDGIERWLSDLIGYQIFNREVYLFDHIPSIVPPLWVGFFVFGAFLFCLVAALVPAWRASRIHPLDALRYE